MARVPITVMGFRCDRCGHEWVPRGGPDDEPRVCPKCHSPYWNRPKKSMMTYPEFEAKVLAVLAAAAAPTTWTEVRTAAKLPQLFPNNQWVRRLERDAGLERHRKGDGIVYWRLGTNEGTASRVSAEAAEATDKLPARPRRKQGPLE